MIVVITNSQLKIANTVNYSRNPHELAAEVTYALQEQSLIINNINKLYNIHIYIFWKEQYILDIDVVYIEYKRNGYQN